MKREKEIKIRKYPAKLPTKVFKDKKKYNRKSKFKKNPENRDFFIASKHPSSKVRLMKKGQILALEDVGIEMVQPKKNKTIKEKKRRSYHPRRVRHIDLVSYFNTFEVHPFSSEALGQD